MGKLVKVEGHPELMKNPDTGVLVNIDIDGYEAAKKRSRHVKQLEEENKNLHSRISALEHLITGLIENGKN